MTTPWSSILDELRGAVREVVPSAGGAITFEFPPDTALGDVAVPCFAIAKELRKPPDEIAARIVEGLGAHPLVAKATVAGPYVNIALDVGELARRVLAAVAERGDHYGDVLRHAEGEHSSKREIIVLEFISPNANKPLHLGHLRNAFLGESIARLLEANGHDVRRVQLVNDRGVHIMKSLLAYERWGKGTTPESEGMKGDHFVGRWYVQFEQKNQEEKSSQDGGADASTELERAASDLLRRWEAGDPEIRARWDRMTNWVLEGFLQTYAMLGIVFEQTYRESAIYEAGRSIVHAALDTGTFVKDDRGNIVAPLRDRFDLDDKVVERANGTTVYATQDLALAAAKERDYAPSASIVVTAREQEYYFRQLFSIFSLLGSSSAGKHSHISYGMVHLPSGRMKSREGTVVDADDLVAELERMALAEIERRADPVPGDPAPGTDEPRIVMPEDAEVRARAIALAALRFYLLHVTPQKDVTFDPAGSLAFTGKTGPYLQYMHARMCAIQRKAGGSSRDATADPTLLAHPAEKALLLQIARFPDVIAAAASGFDPATLAQFCYDLAQTFADFYRDVPVLHADTAALRAARLTLVAASRTTLARGLSLLGIAAIETM